MWFVYRTNPAISFWDTRQVMETMSQFPFTVCFAYTRDETNHMADILLPDRTDLEGLLTETCAGRPLYALTTRPPGAIVRKAFARVRVRTRERRTPSLHDRYKTVWDVEALLGAREALTEAPEAAQFRWKATSKWMKGTHTQAACKGFFGLGEEQRHKTQFTFDADHPEIFASEDHGATPVEIVLVGLASCLTAGVAAVAQHREIQLNKVSATIEVKRPTGEPIKEHPLTAAIRVDGELVDRFTSEERILDEMRAGLRELAKRGITEIHDITGEPFPRRYATLQENGELTARVWEGGWYRSGDRFTRDTAGNYYFVDRMSDAIRQARALFPASRPADATSLRRAHDFVSGLQAGGGEV